MLLLFPIGERKRERERDSVGLRNRNGIILVQGIGDGAERREQRRKLRMKMKKDSKRAQISTVYYKSKINALSTFRVTSPPTKYGPLIKIIKIVEKRG